MMMKKCYLIDNFFLSGMGTSKAAKLALHKQLRSKFAFLTTPSLGFLIF